MTRIVQNETNRGGVGRYLLFLVDAALDPCRTVTFQQVDGARPYVCVWAKCYAFVIFLDTVASGGLMLCIYPFTWVIGVRIGGGVTLKT